MSNDAVIDDNVGRRCLHTKVGGEQCHALALEDSRFCYFHRRYNEFPEPMDRQYMYNTTLPAFEDPRSVVLAVYHTIDDYRRGRIDAKCCSMSLYGLQIASNMLSRPEARSPLDQQKLEAEALALLQLKMQSKLKPAAQASKDENKNDEDPEGPSLIQILLDTLLEMKRGEWKPSHLDED